MNLNSVLRAKLLAVSAFLATGFLGGCGAAPSKPTRTTFEPHDYRPTDGVPSCYHFLYSGGLEPKTIEEVWSRLPYVDIELERTECFGQCQSYVVTLKAGGAAEYNGRKYAPRTGIHHGEIDVWNYAQLCWAIDRFKIVNGPREYIANWSDDASTIIRVKNRSDNKVIEILDYGGQGPIELWCVSSSIDAVADRVKWTAKK